MAYIVAAAGEVIGYELSGLKAKKLWSLQVQLHGSSGPAANWFKGIGKSVSFEGCIDCTWPATVATNQKKLLLQSEDLWVYDLINRKKPINGRKIKGMGTICKYELPAKAGTAKALPDGGNLEKAASCGQIAVGRDVAFSLTGGGQIFKISLEDHDTKPVLLVNVSCQQKHNLVNSFTGLAIEEYHTEQGVI